MVKFKIKILHHDIFSANFVLNKEIIGIVKEYTKNQLALRNGQDKDDIWVAYKGQIYDVGSSRLWRNGKHYEHWAGQDLTEELADAPHKEAVFEKFKIIGKLI